jgi:alpha-L-rhamnosidase
MIGSSWNIKENMVTLNLEVPGNTHAEVLLPCTSQEDISENQKPLVTGIGIEEISSVPNGVQLILGSGTYSFTFPATNTV